MCKILTQDKSILIDVSNTDIYIEQKDKNIFNICVHRYNRSVVLDTYRTEEYAKFVLDLLGENLGREKYFKMSEFNYLPEQLPC